MIRLLLVSFKNSGRYFDRSTEEQDETWHHHILEGEEMVERGDAEGTFLLTQNHISNQDFTSFIC